MRRATMTARVDWRPGVKKYEYGDAAAPAGALWREDCRYEFSAEQIDMIESVADELHAMVREAIRQAVDGKLLGLLAMRGEGARMVEGAWASYWSGGRANEREGGLVGRLDLAYDGKDSIKLLGCNYDMPDGLFAASIVQWNWLEARYPSADQFNGLHEAIVERWEELAKGVHGRTHVHFACATPDAMREGELAYLAATAAEAGLGTTILPMQDIGWDGKRFRDMDETVINWLYKLYPWEALVEDEWGPYLKGSGMSVLEPVWRWTASNHGILSVLWDLYPEHPNLCRASLSESDLAGVDAVTVRTLFGLDHAACRMTEGGTVVSDTGPSANPGGYLWMETPPRFEQDGQHAILQAWIVGDKCLGMTVRESEDPRVGPDAAIVPHLFRS